MAVAFISRIKDIIVDYFDGDRRSFATKCCGSLFAALNSEEKAIKLRERIDTLICVCFGKDKGLFRKRAEALYLRLVTKKMATRSSGV